MAPDPVHVDEGVDLYLLLQHRSRVVDRHDVTIMRLVKRGELVAQCNISRLPDLSNGTRLQVREFQADIERALGKSFGQFVEASENETEEGLRVIRVIALGNVSELPIDWIYYHISDDQGRRVSVVFTLEEKLAEQFEGSDSELVGAFYFVGKNPKRVSRQPDGESTSR